MRNQLAMGVALVLMATVAQAEGWRFSAGPAWRSRVKTEVRGTTPVPTATGGTTRTPYDRDPGAGDYDPAAAVERPDPDMPGDNLYAVGASFQETTIVPGDSAARFRSDDTDETLGFSASLGRDVWSAGPVSVGLDLRFVGYWNLRSSASGFAGGGTSSTRTGTDWWLFKGGPYPGDSDFSYAPNPERDDRVPTDYGDAVTTLLPGRTVRSRLKADLYQFGIGPTVTWRACSWLEAFAGAEVILNLASTDLRVGDASESDVDCLLGFGGRLGLVARLTENLGLFGQVGYEWVDMADVQVGNVAADVDFSSLVLAVGLQVSF